MSDAEPVGFFRGLVRRVTPESGLPDLLVSFIRAAALSLLHFFLADQKEMKIVFLNTF